MRNANLICLTLVVAFMNSLAFAIDTVENKRDWMAQNFIANQIKGIGLVDSYQEDNEDVSYAYDNALAAMASMALGNFGLAIEILDTLCSEVNTTEGDVPFESYSYSDDTGAGKGLAYCGNSAWLLQALNIYQKQKSSKRYYKAQKKLADFLLTLQDAQDGALRGSSNDYWKSTEHNIVAYAALNNFGALNKRAYYIKKAMKVKNFIVSQQIWDGTRFNQGAGDTGKVTDVQALGVLLLGKNYSSALTWAEENLGLTKAFDEKTVTGFDFNDDLDTVWLEGTLQSTLAFYSVGNSAKADFYYNEATKVIQDDGAMVLATNQGSANDSWTLERWRAIAPTAWLIFYYKKFNPLRIYSCSASIKK